jgi:hypothetical protein
MLSRKIAVAEYQTRQSRHAFIAERTQRSGIEAVFSGAFDELKVVDAVRQT